MTQMDNERPDEVFHYGTKRESGRYPYGSGDVPYQHEPWFEGFGEGGVSSSPYAQELWYNNFDYGGTKSYQRAPWFCDEVLKLKKQGLSEKDICKKLTPKDAPIDKKTGKPKEMSINELRSRVTVSRNAKQQSLISQAEKLKATGMSNTAIATEMFGDASKESTVRNLLDPSAREKSDVTFKTMNMLKDEVDKKEFIDVGVGAEYMANVSRTKLNAAVSGLVDEGYKIHYLNVTQLGTGEKTSLKVLGPPGSTYNEAKAAKNDARIGTLGDYYFDDKGKTFLGIKDPVSIDSKRIDICAAEEGGKLKDGLIELRRGVDDLSIGNSKYAQVRIAVDGKFYIKGMAVYADDLPKGIDIRVNSNKSRAKLGDDPTGYLKLMKGLEYAKDANGKETKKIIGKVDKDNPFGASIKESHDENATEEDIKLLAGGQYEYLGKDGKKHLGAVNKVNEEGDWSKWSRNLASEFLAKQPVPLVKRQLDVAYKAKQEEFDRINELTNPVVKKRLMESFADECDSDAVNLKAAAMPRQATSVILPSKTLKDGQIYATNFKEGEEVILIRYPHGGKFEIPHLKVTHRNAECKKMIGTNPKDAVCINSKTAAQLSGADFDGDTVLVIPNNNHSIQHQNPLDGLKDFDTGIYKAYPGMPKVKHQAMQTEMGKITNLITDMTIKGAGNDELARAVKHSMVVIDAEKHNLDYKRSYDENGIAALKEYYQGGANKGASTLISQAKSEYRVADRKRSLMSEGGPTDPVTGEKRWTEKSPKDSTYKQRKMRIATKKDIANGAKPGSKVPVLDENGNEIWEEKRRTIKSTKMYEAKDAYELSSGTRVENAYADYANNMKKLGNKARLAAMNTPKMKYDPEAAIKYKEEVEDLKAANNLAKMNSPKERQAQILGNKIFNAKKRDNPDRKDDKDWLKKMKGQAISGARSKVGAKKQTVNITPKQWEAIQAGAIRQTLLEDILKNTSLDVIQTYATPYKETPIDPARTSRVKSLLNMGYPQAYIAEQLGISASTVNRIANE